MTREEAMQRLSDLQDGSGQTYEAIRMAIEALKGGDAEMLNEDFRPKYMQQSRQADMMLVDLNSKDGYLLDGKYKINGCEDLTDGRVEVVRCKDCKWAEKAILDEYCVECTMYHTSCMKHGYCHHGERREPGK